MVHGSSGSRGATRPPFPAPTSLFQSNRPPALASRVHSLVLAVLSGVSSPTFPRRLSVRRNLPWGFFPLRDVTEGIHIARDFPLPALFRPQVFTTSRRFAPPSASRACFIPQPRPGFPFRVLVPTRSRADSSPAVPPCPCCEHTHRLPGCHISASELRGLVPRGEAIIGVGGWPSSTTLPSSVFPPPGPFVRIAPSRRDSAWAPLMAFSTRPSPVRCRSGDRPADGLQRVSDTFAGDSSPRTPACSRFLPSVGPFTF